MANFVRKKIKMAILNIKNAEFAIILELNGYSDCLEIG